jgi:hypothetical protein
MAAPAKVRTSPVNRSSLLLRRAVSVYGFLLGAASLWILLAELSRPGVTILPTTRELAATAAAHRSDAMWAARIGVIRGELWAEAAFTYANLAWADNASAQTTVLQQANATATRAINLAPGNSAVWLLLAELASRYGQKTPNPIETVKMSYYTGPREDALEPLRLGLSAQLNVSADPELERLFRSDIETILTSRPGLKPAVLSAYALATPQARQIIDDTAGRVDPAFAQTLRSNPFR